MFTKSIQPGDWVKCVSSSFFTGEAWFEIVDVCTENIFKGKSITSYAVGYYTIHRSMIVERIGDRPLDTPPLNCSNPWIDTRTDVSYRQVMCHICGPTWSEIRA